MTDTQTTAPAGFRPRHPAKRVPLHKVGIGGVYKSKDGRACAVQKLHESFSRNFGWGHYFNWIARFDGKYLGEGSLAQCRKLINEAAQLDEAITWDCT